MSNNYLQKSRERYEEITAFIDEGEFQGLGLDEAYTFFSNAKFSNNDLYDGLIYMKNSLTDIKEEYEEINGEPSAYESFFDKSGRGSYDPNLVFYIQHSLDMFRDQFVEDRERVKDSLVAYGAAMRTAEDRLHTASNRQVEKIMNEPARDHGQESELLEKLSEWTRRPKVVAQKLKDSKGKYKKFTVYLYNALFTEQILRDCAKKLVSEGRAWKDVYKIKYKQINNELPGHDLRLKPVQQLEPPKHNGMPHLWTMGGQAIDNFDMRSLEGSHHFREAISLLSREVQHITTEYRKIEAEYDNLVARRK